MDPPKIGLGAFGFNFGALHLAEAGLASAPSARTIVARAGPASLGAVIHRSHRVRRHRVSRGEGEHD